MPWKRALLCAGRVAVRCVRRALVARRSMPARIDPLVAAWYASFAACRRLKIQCRARTMIIR